MFRGTAYVEINGRQINSIECVCDGGTENDAERSTFTIWLREGDRINLKVSSTREVNGTFVARLGATK